MDRVNLLANERVGLPDAIAGMGGRLAQNDQIREGRLFAMPSGRTTGAAAASARILDGFDWQPITLSSDTSATMNRGRGFLPFLNEESEIQFGLLFGAEGVASITFDFTTVTAGITHAVYVRAVTTPAAQQNRVFWNPNTSAEFVDNLQTRLVAGWEMTVQAAANPAPGNGEWVKVWEVTLDGSNQITAITDYRHLYFEGDANAASYASEWGDGANDRDTDRATYGIKDSHLWNQAVRRQLRDIIGDGGWYKSIPRSLKSADQKLARVVTVDQPGGPGADGDYATISAAVTALNAANGGTILLRSGTYVLTAAIPAFTKAIRVIAVESGVILDNQINTDNVFMFSITSTGAIGSELKGFQIDGGTDSSEHAIQVSDAFGQGVILRELSVAGEILIRDHSKVTMDSVYLVEDSQFLYSDRMMTVTGAAPQVTMLNCRINIASGLRTESIVIESITAGTGANATMRGLFEMVGCAGRALLGSSRFLHANVSGDPMDIVLDFNMTYQTAVTVTSGAILINGGASYIKSVRVRVEAGPSTNPIFRVIGSSTQFDRCYISHLEVIGNGTVHELQSPSRCCVVLNGPFVKAHGLHVSGWQLPDDSISGSAANRHCLVAVGASGSSGRAIVSDSNFDRISAPAVNDVFHSILGRPAGLGSIDAYLEISRCYLNGDQHDYNTATSDNSMMLVRDVKEVHLLGNTFRMGHFRHAIRTDDTSGHVKNNTIDADRALGGTGVGFDQLILMFNGAGTKHSSDVSGNIVKVLSSEQRIATAVHLSVIGINHDGVSCMHNHVYGADAGATADINVIAVNVTMYGNIGAVNSVSATASGTQKPGILTDHNI